MSFTGNAKPFPNATCVGPVPWEKDPDLHFVKRLVHVDTGDIVITAQFMASWVRIVLWRGAASSKDGSIYAWIREHEYVLEVDTFWRVWEIGARVGAFDRFT